MADLLATALTFLFISFGGSAREDEFSEMSEGRILE